MSETAAQGGTLPVADYKRILQRVLENRPSGTRQRLATALGTNRSFVTQMTNPAYAMPIPLQHLDSIFEVCHFSHSDRAAFNDAYGRAHPDRQDNCYAGMKTRTITVAVSDLGDAQKNRALDEIIAKFARQISRFAEDFDT
ncbi:MAG: hypothetical protein ABSC06_16510 [Rhodopila sp.]|jgi:hypothetical protein